MSREGNDIFSLLQENLRQDRLSEAVRLLANLHPVDIAVLSETLDEHEKKKLFRKLDINFALEIIAELSEFSQDQIVAGLSRQRLSLFSLSVH